MYDDAILQGQKYTEKWPEDPNGWNVLSRSYGKKGMKIKAEEAMNKAQRAVAVTIDIRGVPGRGARPPGPTGCRAGYWNGLCERVDPGSDSHNP